MRSIFGRLRFWAVLTAAVTPLAVSGQDQRDADWNHFGVDFRLGFNIKGKFSNVGAFNAQPAPPISGGVDHTYSDGFVHLDSSGDRGGLTWNWGYQNSSQLSGSGTILMHAASTEGATSGVNDEPREGAELTYARDIGSIASGRWGVKVAFGFTDIRIRDTQTLRMHGSMTSVLGPIWSYR
jgi:hypothetical protein